MVKGEEMNTRFFKLLRWCTANKINFGKLLLFIENVQQESGMWLAALSYHLYLYCPGMKMSELVKLIDRLQDVDNQTTILN